jgi:acetyltransferase-like isoleucine patch superfamily enzyme
MSLRRVSDDLIFVGPHAVIDPTARIGEQPGREIADLTLHIGEEACIRSGSVIYAGSTIGTHFNLGHNTIVREQNRIGDHVNLWGNSTVDYGCVIGNRVKIHANVYVAQFTVIEDEVFLAPGVILANDPHPGCPRAHDCMRGPTIRRGAQIGVNVTELPFVTIGERALIGAGSVVTRDIPPRAVAYGNPARVIGTIDDLRCVANPPFVERPYSPASSIFQGV